MNIEHKCLEQQHNKIFYCECIPEEPKGVVLLLHGYGNHYGYFEEFIDILYKNGYVVYAYDHKGHGRSEGDRGYIEKYETLVEDMDKVIKFIKSIHSNLPLFTYGHSMGGLISFIYGIKNPSSLNGQIFSAPALGNPWGTEYIPDNLYQFFKENSPKFRIYSTVFKRKASNNRKRIRECRRDKLKLKYGTIGLFYEFIYRGISWAKNNSEKYTLPCLIMHGKEDKIIPYENSVAAFYKIKSENKNLKLFRGLNHELLHEPNNDIVISEVIKWINTIIDNSKL